MNIRVKTGHASARHQGRQRDLAVSWGRTPASEDRAPRAAPAITVILTGCYRAEALVEPPIVVDYEERRRGSPICDLARKLVKAGYDPEAPVLIWRGETLCFNPAPLRAWAKLRAVERDGRSIRFEKWEAMPASRAAALRKAKRE